MRKRIQTQSPIAEKVYSTRTFSEFPIRGREISKYSNQSSHSKIDKLERIQEREIRRMFKHLTVKSMIDEKTYLRSLRELPTTKQVISFLKEITVPQSYETIHDVILGDYKVGKNYLKTFIEENEVVSVINWNDNL